MKVTVRRNKNKKSKKWWWVSCSLCKIRSHTRKKNWVAAMNMAHAHAYGKQHQNKLRRGNT